MANRLPMLTMRPMAACPGPLAGGRVLRARLEGRGGPARPGQRKRTPHKNFFIFYCKLATNGLTSIGNLGMTKQGRYTARMTFKSLPLTVREIKATEATLERIYEAAYLGLKGDSLALAAGMLPVEYARLKQLDQIAELAELKGRADSEREHSQHLRDAARNGDAKAALEILKHAHGWVAKQAVSIEVDQRISVIDALRAAESRVIEGAISEGSRHLDHRQTVRLDNAKADLQSR